MKTVYANPDLLQIVSAWGYANPVAFILLGTLACYAVSYKLSKMF